MKTSVLLALPLLIAGCARPIDAPSLAIRPIENRVERAALPMGCTDTDSAGAIARLNEEAAKAQVEFDKTVPRAATGQPPKSEAWIAAQTALSAAEIARGRLLDVLAKFDDTLQRLANTSCDTGGYMDARAAVQRTADADKQRLYAVAAR